MTDVPYIYLAVTVAGVLGVATAYRPIKIEPVTVGAFFIGWLCGELAIQNIVWTMAATVAFAVFGAFAGPDAWAGWLGLALAVACWVGLSGLAVAGRRSGQVVVEALARASGPPLGATVVPPRPAWSTWWRMTRAVPLRNHHTEIVADIDYWGDGIRRHRLDVYRSRTNPPRGAPVLVYIHGGAWIVGDKRQQGKPMMFELVAQGWVCVTINYRLSPRATWPEHIVDCKRAIAWVREHVAEYGGDPSFIALSGGSAGGHLCALAALTANDPAWQPGFEEADTSVDACVPFYGVMDMTGDRSGSGRYGPGLKRLLEKRVMKTSGREHPEVFTDASPTCRVHEGAPPFFVLHGANDTLVPVAVARTFVSELRRVSAAPVAYAELPLAQHAFDVLASLRAQATTGGVVAFLEAVRAGRPAASPPEIPAPTRGDDTPSTI